MYNVSILFFYAYVFLKIYFPIFPDERLVFKIIINIFISISIYYCVYVDRLLQQQVRYRNSRRSSSQLFMGDPKVSPDQREYTIPPKRSTSSPTPSGSLPYGTCPENLQWEASRRQPNQMLKPPHLTPFVVREQWLCLKLLLDGGAPYPTSMAEPGNHLMKALFSSLCPGASLSINMHTK